MAWKTNLVDGEVGEPKGFDAGGAPGMKMWDCVARRGLFGKGSMFDDRVGVLVSEVDKEVKTEDGEEDDEDAEMTKFASGFRLVFWL